MESMRSQGCNPAAGRSTRKEFWRLFAIILPLVMTIMLFNTACSTSTPPLSSANGPVRYHVIVEETPFFKFGPAQAGGADFKMRKGREVIMIERHYGYSRVQTEDGESGYTATDDIAPSPNQPSPDATPVKKSGGGGYSRGGGRTPNFEQPNDAALPSAQQPNDAPAPSFRY